MAQINPLGEKKRGKNWKNRGKGGKGKGGGQAPTGHKNKYAQYSKAPVNTSKVFQCVGCGIVLVRDEDKQLGKCASCRRPSWMR